MNPASSHSALLTFKSESSMNHKEYNGWYNYETWCFNVHHCGDDFNETIQSIIDNYERELGDPLTDEERHVIQLSDHLKDYLNEFYHEHTETQWTLLDDLLTGAMQEINWHELAKNYYEAYIEDYKDE